MSGQSRDAERRGRLVDWNDARGFGFIEDDGVDGRVFVHVKDFRSSQRPSIGAEIAYTLVAGRDGRPAAGNARIVGGRSPASNRGAERRNAPMRVTVRVTGALVLATTVIAATVSGNAPPWLPLVYLAGGIVSFVTYWLDKRAAAEGRWRTMEETLHLLDLAFGIAGGLLAQGALRHKISKQAFGIVTTVIFVVHMAVLGLLLAGYGPAEWLAWLSA